MLGELPSASTVREFIRGEAGFMPVLGTTVLRAMLIGAGMYAVGERKNIVRNAMAGATAIEVFVMLWTLSEEKA